MSIQSTGNRLRSKPERPINQAKVPKGLNRLKIPKANKQRKLTRIAGLLPGREHVAYEYRVTNDRIDNSCAGQKAGRKVGGMGLRQLLGCSGSGNNITYQMEMKILLFVRMIRVTKCECTTHFTAVRAPLRHYWQCLYHNDGWVWNLTSYPPLLWHLNITSSPIMVFEYHFLL